MPNTEDIAVLFPNRKVKAKGVELPLRPFYFGELPLVMRLASPVLQASGLARVFKVVQEKGKVDIKFVLPENFLDLLLSVLVEAGEPLIELMNIVLKQDRAWYNDLPADEGLELAQAWFDTNKDFFSQRVLPKLPGLIKMMANQDGLTSSLSSSPTGTDALTLTPTP